MNKLREKVKSALKQKGEINEQQDGMDIALCVFDFENKKLVGQNMKGKPDSKGKLYRDNIVAGALKNKKGWEEYMYKNSATGQEALKKSYYELCEVKGKKYIVVVGLYIDEIK